MNKKKKTGRKWSKRKGLEIGIWRKQKNADGRGPLPTVTQLHLSEFNLRPTFTEVIDLSRNRVTLRFSEGGSHTLKTDWRYCFTARCWVLKEQLMPTRHAMQCNITLRRVRVMFIPPAILTAWYHSTRRESFYGDLISPAIIKDT